MWKERKKEIPTIILRKGIRKGTLPARPSWPWVVVSPLVPASSMVPVSTLIPVMTPPSSSTLTNGFPAKVFWYRVSSYMSTPLRNWCVPGAVKSISRSACRVPSVFSTLMLVILLPIVDVLSSAARIPFPGVAMYFAVLISSSDTNTHTHTHTNVVFFVGIFQFFHHHFYHHPSPISHKHKHKTN